MSPSRPRVERDMQDLMPRGYSFSWHVAAVRLSAVALPLVVAAAALARAL